MGACVWSHKAEETEQSVFGGLLAKKKKVATHTLVHVQRVDRHLLVTKSQGLTLPLWGVA